MEKGERVRRPWRDADDSEGIVENCAKKVAFIKESLLHESQCLLSDPELFAFTDDARTGLHHILNDLQDDLEFAIRRDFDERHSPITENREVT